MADDQKAALIAIANMFSSTSHWFTPYFFLTNQAPLYQFGGALIIVSLGLSILVIGALQLWVRRLNKKLDASEAIVNEERLSRGRAALDKGWRYPM